MDGIPGTGAVVTGASRGIGRAIGARLCALGGRVLFVARSSDATDAAARAAGANASSFAYDITAEDAAQEIVATALKRFGRLDILVHSAGAVVTQTTEAANLAHLDEMYRVNLRAPVALTQAALPALRQARGHVVFVNSTILHNPHIAGRGGYAATKHALKAFADALRNEVSQDGVRVLSVMVGKAATPMQARLHKAAGKPYAPERLLQPDDVAQAVCDALVLPRTAEMTDITVRHTSTD